MGCAGMARFRDRLEGALEVAVIEPSQAAVAAAIGLVQLGWRPRLDRSEGMATT